jgi:hypothetical protein
MAAYQGIRTELSTDQRIAELSMTIDPGFVNPRVIQTVLGQERMQWIDQAIAALPNMPSWMLPTRIDHVYTSYLLAFCRAMDIHTLGSLLANGAGRLFCSTVTLAPNSDVYGCERSASQVILEGDYDLTVRLEYSTTNIHADTTRSQLANGGVMAVIALFHQKNGNTLIFHPLLMGSPWLSDGTDVAPFDGPEWHSFEYFEIFIEDIDEFSKVRTVPTPTDFSVMGQISESAFKHSLGDILGDNVTADWGGERSDHFSAHLHLQAKATTGGFLLKGPGGGFKPMTLDHLGKRNDQIYRLAQEPAQTLFVQHCHDITGAPGMNVGPG